MNKDSFINETVLKLKDKIKCLDTEINDINQINKHYDKLTFKWYYNQYYTKPLIKNMEDDDKETNNKNDKFKDTNQLLWEDNGTNTFKASIHNSTKKQLFDSPQVSNYDLKLIKINLDNEKNTLKEEEVLALRKELHQER